MTKEIITVKIEIEGENNNIEEPSEFTTLEEIREKQSMVNIDFTRDNYLPRLNKEDLKELNKEDKPVLLKKSIIDRNFWKHSDIKEEDYNLIIATALYEPIYIFPGNNPEYMNFIGKIKTDRYSAVLIDMVENIENYEIVHIHKMTDKTLKYTRRRDDKNYKE